MPQLLTVNLASSLPWTTSKNGGVQAASGEHWAFGRHALCSVVHRTHCQMAAQRACRVPCMTHSSGVQGKLMDRLAAMIRAHVASAQRAPLLTACVHGMCAFCMLSQTTKPGAASAPVAMQATTVCPAPARCASTTSRQPWLRMRRPWCGAGRRSRARAGASAACSSPQVG